MAAKKKKKQKVFDPGSLLRLAGGLVLLYICLAGLRNVFSAGLDDPGGDFIRVMAFVFFLALGVSGLFTVASVFPAGRKKPPRPGARKS